MPKSFDVDLSFQLKVSTHSSASTDSQSSSDSFFRPKHSPSISPKISPTVPPQTQTSAAPALKKPFFHFPGETIVTAIVIALCGVQLYPPAWRWIEQKLPLHKFFNQTSSNPIRTHVNFQQAELKQTPRKGEKILQWRVTSPFGARSAPCRGCSSFHNGVDVATPVGTPLFAPAFEGQMVKVQCKNTYLGGLSAIITTPAVPDKTFAAVHLSRCLAGNHPPGDAIAFTGNSGAATTGPHLHWTQRNADSQAEPPAKGYLRWVLSGVYPDE